MTKRTSATLFLLLALAAFAPAAAHAVATTYCVNTAGCAPPNNMGTVQAALDAATLNAGHDSVRIGPGTYSGPFSGSDVELIGAGRTTILTAPAGSNQTVVNLGSPINTSNVWNLAITVPNGSGNTGLKLARGSARNVVVGGGTGASNAVGIRSTASQTVSLLGAIVALRGGGSTGATADVGDLVVRDSAITTPAFGILGADQESLRVTRTSVTANTGVIGGRACTVVEDSLVLLTGTAGRGIVVPGGQSCVTLGTATLDVRNITLIGNGAAGSIGVDVAATATTPPAPNRSADAIVASSVIRGTAISFRRTGDIAGPGEVAGNARLRVRYSLYSAALGQAGPPGPAEGIDNLPGNPDPLFASASTGDFTPLPGSPLIDAGDPRDFLPGESQLDIVGRPRKALGGLDIGAFRLQALPPPPDRKGPKLRILTSSARLTRKGELKVRVSCPKVETEGCVGTTSAASASKLRLKKKAKKRTLRFGSRRFSMAAGKSKVVVIKVAKTARREVAKRKKMRVKVTVAATDDAGNVGRVSRTLTVRPPKPAKKRKR